MTPQEQILSTLRRLEKKVDQISKDQTQQYLTCAEIRKRFGVSPDTIRKMRYSGKLTDYRTSISGRNFQYSISELEKYLSVK